MKHLNRVRSAASVAGIGASVLSMLFFSAMLGRTSSARAQSDPPAGTELTAEPSEDPSLEPAYVETKDETRTPETAIRKWPAGARTTARVMISKYGEPSRFSAGSLVWFHNGPWLKTVVYRSAWPRIIGKRDKDYLEQTIAYQVPDEKVNDLKRFDARIKVSENGGQLSARSESEGMNFLALNLVDEIATGARSVEDARDFYSKTARLSKAGKSSAYMEGLLFPNRRENGRLPEREPSDDRGMMP
jgi:hypothetical protein